MAAYTNITEIVCNGSIDGCPDRRVAKSYTASGPAELRVFLAREGWESIQTEAGVVDRCPSCGVGTP